MILMQIRIALHEVEKDGVVKIRQLSTDEWGTSVESHDGQKMKESRFEVPHRVVSQILRYQEHNRQLNL